MNEDRITKLDEFAMRFAPELIRRHTGCGTAWDQVARSAYDAAEAMMSESDRRGGETKASALLRAELARLRNVMDAVYNHNEAARAAVIQHYGLWHTATVPVKGSAE